MSTEDVPPRVVDVEALRVASGSVDLGALAADATPGFTGGKAEGQEALAGLAEHLVDLQEQLWANRDRGTRKRVLLVLQGMDTSGKGGTIRKTLGLVDPRGLQVKAFSAPTEEELRHDFLWRVRRAIPTPGHIGVFDRSHYEDVLVAKVRGLAPAEEVEQRYRAINEFESELVEDGVALVKCMLHISPEKQEERLAARLDKPEKHWKYDPGDLDDRACWSEYQTAYQVALERTGTAAPWHVVPADRKWFRNLAVAQLLVDALDGLGLEWPAADFDVEKEKRRLESLVLR